MWKKLIVSVLLVLALSGCATTDAVYDAGKVVYLGGKKVVINNYDLLSEDAKRKLETIDDYASAYDANRKKLGVAISYVTPESSSSAGGN